MRQAGISSLSLFGSVARGEDSAVSDIDLAMTPDRNVVKKFSLLDLVGMEQRLSEMLRMNVDLVVEPSEKPRLQAQIDRDRVRAF